VAEGYLCNQSLEQYQLVFLILICSTFCIGITTVFICNYVQLTGDLTFSSDAQRNLFANRMSGLSTWLVRGFRLAMFLFLVVHGSYGWVRMNPISMAPFSASMFCCVLLVALYNSFDRSYNKAVAKDVEVAAAKLADPDAYKDQPATSSRDRLISVLGTWPVRSLYFGSFSYFGVMYFYTPDRAEGLPYLICMGLAFALAVVVTAMATFVKMRLGKLSTDHGKEVYATELESLMNFLYYTYLSTVVLFFAGFLQIGYVKPGFAQPWDQRYSVPIQVMGSAGLVSAFIFIVSDFFNVGIAKKVDAKIVFEQEYSQLAVDATANYSAWKARTMQRNLQYAVQAAFVGGNAFFDCYFCDISTYDQISSVASMVYVTAACLSCVMGCLVVLGGTMTAVSLVSDKIYQSIESYIFTMFTVMTFTWLLEVLTLDKTRLKAEFWGTTFYWGLFGILSYIVAFSTLRGNRATTSVILEQGVAGKITLKEQADRS
jgi:hypothetical protein